MSDWPQNSHMAVPKRQILKFCLLTNCRRWRGRRWEAQRWMRTGCFVAPPRGIADRARGWMWPRRHRQSPWARAGPLPVSKRRLKTRPCHVGSWRAAPGRWESCGGPRGSLQRSNTSMTIMRPPQHGHSGWKSSGSSDVSSFGRRGDVQEGKSARRSCAIARCVTARTFGAPRRFCRKARPFLGSANKLKQFERHHGPERKPRATPRDRSFASVPPAPSGTFQ